MLDYVSKAAAWPIDPALFAQLEWVGWDHRLLSEAGLILLEHAVLGLRGWLAERGDGAA